MYLKSWKIVFFGILLASSGGSWCCIRVDVATAANTQLETNKDQLAAATKSLTSTQIIHLPCQRWKLNAINSCNQQSGESESSNLHRPFNLTQQTPTTDQVPAPTEEIKDTQQPNQPPQLEIQPKDFPNSSPESSSEELLNTPEINESERLEKLWQQLQEQKLPPLESDNDGELRLRLRPRPLEQLPAPRTEPPVAKLKPIGSLKARVGYFQTSNIFSSDDNPIEDGLIVSGLRFTSAYFPLGSKTYLNGSIDGNIIRYINQSKYNYNQIKFNVSIYQQLSQRMYGEISWSNQQLFYANNSDRSDSYKAGDRFFNENSLQLSLGRRDPLTSRLTLDSFYELSVDFADPQSRNRVVNFFWLSLNYYLEKPLQVGLNYQFNFSDFTQREREDQFHRLFGNLNYRISDSSNMNVQAGVTLGSSTDPNIDFDNWFFSINYNIELGRF